MLGHNPTRRFMVSFIVCGLLLAVAIPAAAQSRLYEIQLDIFDNDELIHSPSAIVEEGKSATISIGDTSIALLVASEGMIEGKPTISLTLDITRAETDLQNGTESRNFMSPTLFLPDTMKHRDPATVSIGSADVAVSVRRIEPSKVTEIMEFASQASDCQTDGSATLGDGDASIGDGNCCSKSCADGSGNTMKCCGAIRCCDCGTCCSP